MIRIANVPPFRCLHLDPKHISWYLWQRTTHRMSKTSRYLDIFDILISSISWYLRYLDIFDILISLARNYWSDVKDLESHVLLLPQGGSRDLWGGCWLWWWRRWWFCIILMRMMMTMMMLMTKIIVMMMMMMWWWWGGGRGGYSHNKDLRTLKTPGECVTKNEAGSSRFQPERDSFFSSKVTELLLL